MKRVLMAILVAAVLLPAGCGEAEKEYKGVIGVSVLTFSNPFFKEVAEAIEAEADKHNYRTIIVDPQEDPDRQLQQVRDFITQQVDAIILCPCDCKAVGAAIVEANKAGIPVFTADLASLADQGEVVCHVATDNLNGGRLAGKAVIEMLGGSGKVAVLDYNQTESCRLRVNGFKEAIEEAEGIEVVCYWPGGGHEKISSDAAKAILVSYPELDAFFCVNDPSAMGAYNAIDNAGRIGKVQVVGFDAQVFARRAVRDGKLYATVVQYPKKIGKLAADAVHRHLVGHDVEKEVLIPVVTYRKADADEDPLLKDDQ